MNVVKDDVCEINRGRIGGTLLCIHIEVALIQNHGSIGILDMNVAIGNVVNAAVSDILTSPSLKAGSVLLLSASIISFL